jgi:hypothetical protein
MGGLIKRLVALAVVGLVAYKVLQTVGVLGGDDEIEFEWAEDAN